MPRTKRAAVARGTRRRNGAIDTIGDVNPAASTAATTESPLDYMLRIMRDPAQDDDRRDAMAKAALPYIHARLTSIDGQVADNEGGTITFTWQPAQK
jgi:hypothetical protein